MIDHYVDMSRSDWERLIDEWILGAHAERDRRILKRRLLDGLIYDLLAEEFQLSVRQTKAIVQKRQAELFAHI